MSIIPIKKSQIQFKPFSSQTCPKFICIIQRFTSFRHRRSTASISDDKRLDLIFSTSSFRTQGPSYPHATHPSILNLISFSLSGDLFGIYIQRALFPSTIETFPFPSNSSSSLSVNPLILPNLVYAQEFEP